MYIHTIYSTERRFNITRTFGIRNYSELNYLFTVMPEYADNGSDSRLPHNCDRRRLFLLHALRNIEFQLNFKLALS